MKRILSFLSLMVLSIFTMTACKGEPSADEVLASDLVNSIILAEDNGVVDGNFSLISKLTRDDAEYPLTWVSDNKNVKITDKVVNDAYVVEVNRNVAEEETANLTVSLNVNKASATRDFKVIVQPYDVFDYLESYSFPLENANLTNKVYELDTEFKAPGADNAAKIEWTVDTDLIKITTDSNGKATATAAVKFEKVPAQFTAKFTYNGETAIAKYNVNVYDTVEYTPVDELKENTSYKLALVQKNLESAYLWVNGKNSANGDKLFASTVTSHTDAKEAFVEKVEGGYHVYLKDGNAKKYMNGYKGNKIKFETTAHTVYSWDAKYKTLTFMDGTDKFFLGTYNKFNTISVSAYSYIAKGNFPLQFYETSKLTDKVYSSEVMVDYEVEKFSMYNLQPGKNNLQTAGKKFNKVEISYKLNGTNNNVTLAEDGKSITGNVISNVSEVKLIVTFKHGEYSVDKDVTVKLNATVTKKLNEVAALKDYTPVTVTGKVVAKEKDGFMLEDASGCMYIRTKDAIEDKVWYYVPDLGKVITFTGVKGSNYGAPQIKPVINHANAEAVIESKAPVAYDKAKLEAAIEADVPTYEQISFIGRIAAGDHINVKLEGTTKTFSIKGEKAVLDQIVSLNELKCELTGYVSGSNPKVGYLTVIANTVVVKDTPASMLATAKKAVEAALPGGVVPCATSIALPTMFDTTLTVTAAGNLAFDAETNTLTVTPTADLVEDDLKIVVTLGELTETISVKVKSKLAPSVLFEPKTEYKDLCDSKNYVKADSVFAVGDINLKLEKGKSTVNPPRINFGTDIRFYSKNTMTFTSEKKIVGVIFTITEAKNNELVSNNGKIGISKDRKTLTWTGETNSLTITNGSGSQYKIKNIQIFYAE